MVRFFLKLCLRRTNFFVFLAIFSLISASNSLFQTIEIKSQDKHFVSGQLIPRDPEYRSQKDSLASLDLEQAWDQTTGDSTVIVAVIDDAFDVNHPDLQSNFIAGYDFVEGDSNPSPSPGDICEDETHGTNMASIIGAVGDNNTGMAGISWNVKIMPLRIGCRYNSSYEQRAIKYALDHGADIINMSYGGPKQFEYESELLSRMKSANVLFVAAAGNHHGNNDYAPMYPADLDIPNMISVGAIDDQNRLTHWSQFGALNVDIAAPGVDVLGINISNPNDYETASGTSVATAVASGVAALIKAKDLQDGLESLNATETRAILMASSNIVESGQGRLASIGGINAKKALDSINQQQPFPVIQSVSWNQETKVKNTVFDPGESGVLSFAVENIGKSATQVSLQVLDHDQKISFSSKVSDLGPLEHKKRVVVELPLQVLDFSGHHFFSFRVRLTSTTNAVQTSREQFFTIESGFLPQNEFVSTSLHENDFDEYKYFHSNTPSGAENIVFELAYDNVTQPIGLSVSNSSRPRVYYGLFGAEKYRIIGADRTRIGGFGVERLSLPLSEPGSFHLAVFSLPNVTTNRLTQQPFSLRTCFTSPSNGNQLPVVEAGKDISLAVGKKIELSGSASDPEGDLSLNWWDVVEGKEVKFDNPRSLVTTAEFLSDGFYQLRLNASDELCGYAADTVNIIIGDENDLENGLQILPPGYNAPLGGHVSTVVQGQIEGQFVESLRMYSAPMGVEFDEERNLLKWSDVGPEGEHKIRFSGRIKGGAEVKYGTMTISISKSNADENGFFGCSAQKAKANDPIFISMVLFSVLYLVSRSKKVV